MQPPASTPGDPTGTQPDPQDYTPQPVYPQPPQPAYPPQPEQPYAQQPVYPQQPQAYQQPAEGYPQQPAGQVAQQPARKSPLALIIALAVVGALVLCGCGAGTIIYLLDDGGGTGGGGGVFGEGGGSDAQIRRGAEAIAEGCSAFAGAYGHGPALDDVHPYGAVAQFVSPWPTNPLTGQPMTQSYQAGDFTFSTAISMGYGEPYMGYVYGNLPDGTQYSVEFRY